MKYLIDTNVISELRKNLRCDVSVAAWVHAELIPHSGAISVITIGEIRKGIELIATRDPAQAANLAAWLDGLYQHYHRRLSRKNGAE